MFLRNCFCFSSWEMTEEGSERSKHLPQPIRTAIVMWSMEPPYSESLLGPGLGMLGCTSSLSHATSTVETPSDFAQRFLTNHHRTSRKNIQFSWFLGKRSGIRFLRSLPKGSSIGFLWIGLPEKTGVKLLFATHGIKLIRRSQELYIKILFWNHFTVQFPYRTKQFRTI